MVIELNTNPVHVPHPAHTPSFQSSFRPTASTISAQATKAGESKGFFTIILDFIKKIFCCCASSKGKDIAKLIEQGKADEAAAAWVAVIEKDSAVIQDPQRRFQKWFDMSASTDSFSSSVDFGKIFFDIDDPIKWAGDHKAAFTNFIVALPKAVEQSSNPSIAALAQPLELWLAIGLLKQ